MTILKTYFGGTWAEVNSSNAAHGFQSLCLLLQKLPSTFDLKFCLVDKPKGYDVF